jgi:hypothetical protein
VAPFADVPCVVGILRPTLLPSRCHTVHYQLNDHETSSQKQTRLSFLSTVCWRSARCAQCKARRSWSVNCSRAIMYWQKLNCALIWLNLNAAGGWRSQAASISSRKSGIIGIYASNQCVYALEYTQATDQSVGSKQETIKGERSRKRTRAIEATFVLVTQR